MEIVNLGLLVMEEEGEKDLEYLRGPLFVWP
jgi:hypothetical protein